MVFQNMTGNETSVAIFRCTICGDTFNEIDVLEKHIRQLHDFKQPSENFCDLCKNYIRVNLKEHKCKKWNKIKCDEMVEGDVGKFEQITSEERKIGFDQESDKLQKNNFKNQSLKSAEAIDQKEIVAKYWCDVCRKEFGHKSSLKNHIKIDHEAKKEFKCDICPKRFGAAEYLKRHKSRLHSNSRKKNEFECDICKIMVNRRCQIKVHKAQVHEEIKKHICPQCNKAFAIPKTLQIHIKVVHDKIREFVCDICKKSFSVACNLKVHMQNVHKEVKDVHCESCNSSFKSELMLRHHTNYKHRKVFST